MLEMIHKGQVLTPAQLAALDSMPVESSNLSSRNFRRAVDTALKNAGLPVPDIEEGQVVTWAVGTEQDKGKVVSYDERADKYRVMSKLRKREVTITGRDIRVIPAKETVDAPAE